MPITTGSACGIQSPRPREFSDLDHLTHNVGRGRMNVWSGFYERIFNFKEIRYFDIKGEYTGLFSRALTSPDGKIRIPIDANSPMTPARSRNT